MTRATLLIEIGCEEIPARMLPAAAGDVAQVVTDLIERANLAHGEVRPLWSPRRLAVIVEEVETTTASREERLLGPPAAAAFAADGRPTKALEGWARKQGIDPAQITRIQTDKGDYAGATIVRAPRPLAAVLADGFEKAIAAISFPKTMRWGSGEYLFVRPVHWLVALADHELLPLSLFGVVAQRQTRGHRALAPGPHELTCAADYLHLLESARVIVDPQRRIQALRQALEVAAEQVGGKLVEDDELLAESCDIVEWPGALCGSFDGRYVDEVPSEVLSTCLRHHQKGFSIARHAGGGLLPLFGVAVNVPSDPEGHIRRGHEWVVSGRLADALFFWGEDRKQRLDARLDRLEGTVFQRELGTFGQKTRRVERLARVLSADVANVDAGALRRAALLARCDLATGLVGEFPEIQGIVGGLLARADGEDDAVCAAVRDLYLPSGPDDALPATPEGRWLGIADRLDTLVGGFAVGLAPSGSKDPFALRRAGTALIRLALDTPALNLTTALAQALAGYDGGAAGPDLRSRVSDELTTLSVFLFERFGTVAERRIDGLRYDELAAVRPLALKRFIASDLLERLRALSQFRASDDFHALAAASKRVRNILDQAAERGELIEPGELASALVLPEEQELARALDRSGAEVETASAERRYVDALGTLAALRPAVDRFFDKILVMDPDDAKRRARLGLLARLNQQAASVVDLAQVVVEGPR